MRDNNQINIVIEKWSKIVSKITQPTRLKTIIIDRLDRISESLIKKILLYCELDNFSNDPDIKQKFYDYLLQVKDSQLTLVNFFGRRRYFTKEQKID